MVDSVSTCAVMTNDLESPIPGVSIDLSVQYFYAISNGSTILIQAETVKKGRSIVFLTVDILDKESHRLLARGSHVKVISPPGSKL